MHLTTDVPAALLSSQPGLDAAPCRRSAATLDSGGNSAAQTPTQNTRGQAGSLSKPGQAFVDHVWGHAPMAAASQGSTQTGDRVLPLSQSGHTSQNSHGRPESQLGTANKRRCAGVVWVVVDWSNKGCPVPMLVQEGLRISSTSLTLPDRHHTHLACLPSVDGGSRRVRQSTDTHPVHDTPPTGQPAVPAPP